MTETVGAWQQEVWLEIRDLMTEPIHVRIGEEIWVVLRSVTGQESRMRLWPQPPAQQERKE